MRSFAYQTLDVFTDTRFGGNPLAVIPDARGLADREMQAIAREFNYSETTFVLPPADPANTARVRIFTPVSELPFAGHPNVGTGYVLGKLGRAAEGGAMRFEEGAGLVEVTLTDAGEGARIRAPKPFLRRDFGLTPQEVADCLALGSADVVAAKHEPTEGSVGLPFIFAELASLEALARVQPDTAAFARACERHKGAGERFNLFVYAMTGQRALQARMLGPLVGVPEDPATGSACGAMGGLLASLDSATDDDLAYDIAQGVEMGRPSRIHVTARKRAGVVETVHIAGRCVSVMRGELAL
jgi:trans-2,3-dihydro-3-hydroxyanthranilate isomerase